MGFSDLRLNSASPGSRFESPCLFDRSHALIWPSFFPLPRDMCFWLGAPGVHPNCTLPMRVIPRTSKTRLPSCPNAFTRAIEKTPRRTPKVQICPLKIPAFTMSVPYEDSFAPDTARRHPPCRGCRRSRVFGVGRDRCATDFAASLFALRRCFRRRDLCDRASVFVSA